MSSTEDLAGTRTAEFTALHLTLTYNSRHNTVSSDMLHHTSLHATYVKFWDDISSRLRHYT